MSFRCLIYSSFLSRLHPKGVLPLLALIAVLLLGACGSGAEVSGTATDAENTVAGMVVDSTGKPVQGAQVLFVTDASGRYQFYPVNRKQSFHVSIRHEQKAFLVSSRAPDWEASLQGVSLRLGSRIVGQLSYEPTPSSLYRFSDHFRVGIEGAGVTSPAFVGLQFEIPLAPAGSHVLLVFPGDQLLVQKLLDAGVPMDSLVRRIPLQIPEGGMLDLGRVDWKLSNSYLWADLGLAVAQRRLMRGMVTNTAGQPLSGVEVRLISDSLGFRDFHPTDTTFTYTDSSGWWSLPVGGIPAFNLEFMKKQGSAITHYGLLTRLTAAMMANPVTTLPTAILEKAAILRGRVFYTDEQDAWIRLGEHFRVGIKGTSRFLDVRAGELFELPGIPSGFQTLVWYPGDEFLWPLFASALGSQEAMVTGLEFVNSAPGIILDQQMVTYTLPARPLSP